MFSILRRVNKIHIIKLQDAAVYYCSSNSSSANRDSGKVVFISQSVDPYSNLAFEDWLYKNWNFSKRSVLLMWRNSPSVVIGRHQNPFIEANLEYLRNAKVPVIRRNSGGGTVYHDHGNLNCTFFTSRENYNRRRNLELICNALKNDFSISAELNKKDDIVVGNGKVSGTASKLGRLSSYHHCTLLVSLDKLQLQLVLKGDKSLKSKATPSVPSPVTNLQEVCPQLSVERVLESVGKRYLCEDENHNFQQYRLSQTDGFTLVNPTEEWFPGLDDIRTKLESWEWFCGMTPSFTQTRTITIDDGSVAVSIEVNRGLIKDLSVEGSCAAPLKEALLNGVFPAVRGLRYSSDAFAELESRLLTRLDQTRRSTAQ